MTVQEIEISKIKIGKRFRKNIGDVTSLVNSVEQIGLLHPIVVTNNNELIAGFRRIEAFKQLGKNTIPVNIVDLDEDISDAERDENTIRKNFTPDEEEAIYRFYKDREEEKARERQIEGGRKGGLSEASGTVPEASSEQEIEEKKTEEKKEEKRARDEIGKRVGKSGKYVEQNHYIHDMAEKYPNRELQKDKKAFTYAQLVYKVDKNERGYSVKKVYELIRKHEKILTQNAEIKDTVKNLDLDAKVILLNKDSTKINELTDIADNSVDLIVTDPPYNAQSLDLFHGLAKLAIRKLKDGGSLVFYFGQFQLVEMIKLFDEYKDHLTYWWMFAVKHEKDIGARMHGKAITVSWKPLLWYVKGDKRLTGVTIHDFIKSEVPDKQKHPWAQSSIEAEYLIRHLTISEDSIVLDPFLGSGAFGIPAIKLGRYFFGIELDKTTFENTKNYILTETANKE